MNADEYADAVLSALAAVSEQINEYARSLREIGLYKSVNTGNDMRNYDTGWRFEKWVEILLDEELGSYACLWIDLGFQQGDWLINSNISISHGEFHFEFPEKKASNLAALKESLAETISTLKDEMQSNGQEWIKISS